MEDFRYIILSFFLFLAITFPLSVFSYSQNTTHPALTNETIKFFNLHYPNLAIDEEEAKSVIKGSIDEDKNTRPMHHFYDPVHKRGLSLPLEWQSSKKWAQDTKKQAGILKKTTAGTVNSLFSSNSDYSWDRAIYDYVWEDEARGLEGLGHILHLIQDATVPDHTRNDPHPPAFEQDSPYENWASKFDTDSIAVLDSIMNKRPVILDSLNDYFERVANYSNNNFFSKDTILNDIYSNPALESDDIRWEYLSDGQLYRFNYNKLYQIDYRLILSGQRRLGSSKDIKSIIDPDNLIMSDYWTLLSKQAVLYGAGVAKLFFDEVKNERKSKKLYKKNRSWFKKAYDKLEGKIFSISKGLYGSSVNYDDLEDPVQRARSNQGATAVNAVNDSLFNNRISTTALFPERQTSNKNESQEVRVDTENESVEELTVDLNGDLDETKLIEKSERENEPADYKKDSKINSVGDPPSPTPQYIPGFGGGSPGAPTSSEEVVTINSPTITSPSDFGIQFATTTITFEGTSATGNVISQDFSSATTTSSGNDSWSLSIYNLPQGTTTIKFYATKDTDTSSATEIDVGIDTVSPSINTFTILQCQNSLKTDECLSGSEIINLSWTSSSSDIVSYKIYKDSSIQETTIGTSTTLSLSDGESASINISATDLAGNNATSSSQSVRVSTMPVVINEIAWAGTEASAGDEWIELYNRSSDTIDLSDVKLTASDGVPFLNLSGTISSKDYYLIERTDEDPTNVIANLTTVFSGVGGGSGLSNTQETLNLVHTLGGNASTTLDSTPGASACGGSWCAGTTDTNPKTMERVDPDISGSVASNWEDNDPRLSNGLDDDANSIKGTPKSRNSANIPDIGYHCPPETSTFIAGGYYTPSSGSCVYLSAGITGAKYGDLYRGTIGSSTIESGHFLSTTIIDNESGDDITGGVQGEDFFTAIYEVRSGSNDVVDFRDFFKTGSTSAPHTNYKTLEWKYGTSP